MPPLASRRKVIPDIELKVIQVRVLAVLCDGNPSLTRAKLGERAGFTPLSGSVTRAMNGLREGSSSGAAHPGLLALGYVRAEDIDVDGVTEACYEATPVGRAAYAAWLAAGNTLPVFRDRVTSTNVRYKGDS